MELDSRNMLGSIDMLAKQLRHVWDTTSGLTVPDSYRDCDQVVLFGMGGSALGMDMVRAIFADTARAPLLTVNDYTIPGYVHDRTLAILSSYSGTTEETVAVARQITDFTKLVVVLTTGGQLQEFMTQQQWPGYIIDPQFNPCDQPRIAVGYALGSLLRLLTVCGVIQVTDEDIDNIIHYLDGNRELLRDAAKELADQLTGTMPVFVGSEFLLGNLHTIANQTNENGKNFACYFPLPELNHHLMEGLSFPAATQQLHFVLVESHLYYERTIKRYAITQKVLDKQQLPQSTFLPTASTKLLQAFEVLQWGSYLSFYLAMNNRIDPSPIPWVDFFKHALKQ